MAKIQAGGAQREQKAGKQPLPLSCQFPTQQIDYRYAKHTGQGGQRAHRCFTVAEQTHPGAEQEGVRRWARLGHQPNGELVVQIKYLRVIAREDLVSPQRGGPYMVEPQRRAQDSDEPESKEFKKSFRVGGRNIRFKIRLGHKSSRNLAA
jgi:hypothetical protein